MTDIKRIAIVNRGEAASRCLRAIRELRLEESSSLVGIALYTDVDRGAPFVRDADESFALGAPFQATATGEQKSVYLNYDRMLEVLRAVRADAVWPGWGFVSEHPDFVERLETAGITFLGPSSDTMRRLGDKIASKRIAESAQVPVAPWSGGPLDREELDGWASRIGFPLVLKATAGGGGRGIRVVHEARDLRAAYESATNEAKQAFGDGTLFMEARITRARHVEVQMAGDRAGTVLALGLRDCSVQRKHQKVIEEGPPVGLGEGLERALREASVRLLQHVGYMGVATVEYLVTDDGKFYFLEVNPRLQVEHGVTELLTGLDLVKTQIRIARGERLPERAPTERGASIEVRLCAENPEAGFAPSPGRIALLDFPAGPGIRVDAGISSHLTIPSEFDSMIAKILVHGASREEARARLVRALHDTRAVIEGGMTNKGFLLDVLDHEDFRRGGIHTGWLDEVDIARGSAPSAEALIVAAIQAYQKGREAARANFFAEASRGRPISVPPSTGMEVDLVYAGVPYRLQVFALGGFTYRVHLGSEVTQVTLRENGPHGRLLVMGDRRVQVLVSSTPVEMRVEIDGRAHRIESDVGGRVRAPSPSLLIEMSVTPGQRVAVGDRLCLFEAMKCETAMHAPIAGTVREVLARPGERLSAGDVLLVIEPSGDDEKNTRGSRVEFPAEPDPLNVFVASDDRMRLDLADGLEEGARTRVFEAVRAEVRRILLGYDIKEDRAERLIALLSSATSAPSPALRPELAALVGHLAMFADVEVLFSRTPSENDKDAFGPSNDARMAMYLRRIAAEGAGIDASFLEALKSALRHYDISSLEPNDALERAVLRLYSTRTTQALRNRLVTALLGLAIRLSEAGHEFVERDGLREPLDRLWRLRGTVTPTVADLSAQARFLIFDRSASAPTSARPADPSLTMVPPPGGVDLAPYAEPLGFTLDEAARLELWRLANFHLERLAVPGFDGIVALLGHAKDGSGDRRLFCFTEVTDLGPESPHHPDLSIFERRFHAAAEAIRSIRGRHETAQRLHWNRLYVFVRPPLVLSRELVRGTLRRLSPEASHLGIERVLVRLGVSNAESTDAPPQKTDVLIWNPSGGRVEWSVREPHDRPLLTATPYERRVALARSRGLVYPYEIVRLFIAPPDGKQGGIADPIGPGTFVEHDLENGRAVPVKREPGGNTCGVILGVISTPTRKHPEGMRRVIVLSDPTRDMGALSAAECDRIVAAIDLAERERIPVEWVAVSAGARIGLDSGTENLDATARVVRRLVTFTDAGGEVNVILAGVNVGAQSYFDALATMSLQSRGILVMLPSSSMVLTGRAALEFAGGVAAEDEIGIGGYERIMGPNGEAQYRARDLAEAFGILLEHYGVSYVAPGEKAPRRWDTRDPIDRDISSAPYEGDEGYACIGDLFSSTLNPGRKRPFAMRPLMRAVVDGDAGILERWRDWADAQSAIVWDCHIGGLPTTLIGIESRQIARIGHTPNDGPAAWTAATLFPHSSKKVARALNAASGNRPAVILANLSGFDGSPESMRRGVLEMGAEIARSVVRFTGRIAFVVVTRYHGGAYVVFSRELNDDMRVLALQGSYASVIGGAAAAAVVFTRDVRKRAQSDARVLKASADLGSARDPAERATLRAMHDRIFQEVLLEKQAEAAAEFDAVHTIDRAQKVGSIDTVLDPRVLRPTLIDWLAGR